MRQAESLSGGASTEQERAHGSRLSEADGGDGSGNVLHCVVDGEARGHGAAGGVDVEGDGLLRILGFEEEKLGYNAGGYHFFDFAVETNDAFFEESGEYIRW